MRGQGGPETGHDRTLQVDRLLDPHVGAVAGDVGGELVEVAVVDVDQGEVVVDLPHGSGLPAQVVPTPDAHPQNRGARFGHRGRAAHEHVRIMVGRDVVTPRRPDPRDLAGDSRESEDPRRIPVEISAGDIPATVPEHYAPRFEPTGRRLVRVRSPIVEGNRCPRDDRVLEGVEGRLSGAQARLDADERLLVALDIRGTQFAQSLGRGPAERGLSPGARCQTQHGEFVAFEGDVGQGVLALVDPIALLVVPSGRHDLCDERNSQFAQFVLVTLEGSVEGLGRRRRGIRLDGPADLCLGEWAPRVEQHQHQVEQPLGLGGRAVRGTHGGHDTPAIGPVLVTLAG